MSFPSTHMGFTSAQRSRPISGLARPPAARRGEYGGSLSRPGATRLGDALLGRVPRSALLGRVPRPALLGPEAPPRVWIPPPGPLARLLSVLAALLIGAGVLVLADAGTTIVWQEPFTALYAQFRQESLRGDLRVLDRAQPTSAGRVALAQLHEQRRRIAYLASELQRHTRDGSAIAYIRIPKIEANYVVVKGTGTSELESGPGIYNETSFPGVPGATTAIAGHRTTYLAPFRHIDELRPGDLIVLEMPYARFSYAVIGSRTVLPTDVSVIKPVNYARLVLSSCTPPFSASHRLIVFARLTTAVPLGAARLPHGSAKPSPGQAFGEERLLDRALPPVLKASQRLLAPLVS